MTDLKIKTTQTYLVLKCFLSDATKANLLLSKEPATVNEKNGVPQYSCKKDLHFQGWQDKLFALNCWAQVYGIKML